MDKQLSGFAKWSTRSPLGIIALFILLVYLIAGIVTGVGNGLESEDRRVLVWFLVGFPVLVLGVFTWLVISHHTKLYGPADFQKEDNWLRTNGLDRIVEQALALDRAGNRTDAASEEPDIAAIVKGVASGQVVRHQATHAPRRLLWVDDRLEANVWERRAFESQGMIVVQSTDTEDALLKSESTTFSAIISDMRRPESDQAGIELLQKLRKRGNSTPFFVYTGAASRVREAVRHGADGATTDPQSLLVMVNESLFV